MIALIPARVGSKRVTGKNTKFLAGHPLIAYAIAAAKESGVFTYIAVASDDAAALDIGQRLGVTRIWREPVADGQADIVWVTQALSNFREDNTSHGRPDTFAILRPTSPFRTADTIRRAYRAFTVPDGTHDSLRAVEPVTQHPYKMWTWEGAGYPIRPLHVGALPDGTPWHSSPTQALPTMYVQNSSIEMGYTANVTAHGTIHGRKVIPFFTEGYEGFSIDYPEQFEWAEQMVAEGRWVLPTL